jgi:hypothetical protein
MDYSVTVIDRDQSSGTIDDEVGFVSRMWKSDKAYNPS